MKIVVLEEIMPLFGLGRGETGLSSSNCFQSMFNVYLDGEESYGAASLEMVQKIAKIHGHELPPVAATVFSGW